MGCWVFETVRWARSWPIYPASGGQGVRCGDSGELAKILLSAVWCRLSSTATCPTPGGLASRTFDTSVDRRCERPSCRQGAGRGLIRLPAAAARLARKIPPEGKIHDHALSLRCGT